MESARIAPAPQVRRATADDVPALVRLRALMLAEMGTAVGPEDAPWRGAAARWFTERLPAVHEFAVFVVDEPELGVVSSAAGSCEHRAPGPNSPSGLRGHVFNVSTEPAARRRGHARACTEALLLWFAEETGVTMVDLNATQDGTRLYEELGFELPHFPALQLRLPAR
ncbi:GNAT family N-acetyltransferase [Streptomyces sp. NBC_00102]|uniref:GNAT family N-acetyltransferase n=1 Tax=Streptomyces sp. NBC_00102 TaxID=2975652 RepID=UPI00224E6AD9|nr:GNAT family N-acetyltransferase [Streptomyces sp. NBC_00102]MCX5400441.1 GNAT family N-acetyltransferase [Streptomyces sp. NBC_00102]